MRYVITGATSFIGVELCRLLLEYGHDVCAVCRENSSKVNLLPSHKSLRVVYADMSDYRNLSQHIPAADVFVNLAWDATSHKGRDQKEAQWQNVENSMDALFSAWRMGCQLFMESGSQAEYGITTKQQTEQSPCHPFSEYGRSKLAIGEMAMAYAKLTGMKFIHLRIFSIYGEGDKHCTLVMSSLERMLKNEPIDLSQCLQNWNFLYVRDAVRQIVLLSEYAVKDQTFTQEIFQIASEDTRPLRDFVEEMEKATGSSSELRFGTVRPLNIVSLQPDITKTKAAIGYVPEYGFTDGIMRIIARMKANEGE